MMSSHELYPFLDTPALVLDLDKMEANLKEMADIARDAGVKLRPHTKTHKSPYLAKLQLESGASGITVAKLGEAEVMADAGITDICIAYPICGEIKLSRLKRLFEKADVSISLDSVEVAKGISAVGEEIGRQISILLKINTGLNRCGVLPGEEALAVARQIPPLPGVELMGILTHEGHVLSKERSLEGVKGSAIEAGEEMVKTADLLRSRGINIREVSVGSTPTARYIAYVPGITEIRPGTYIFNDLNEIACGVATEDTCAVTVLVTVVSIPADDRAVIDGGSKTLSSDPLAHKEKRGFGYIKGHPDITVDHMTEEHGILKLKRARNRLRIGERLEIIPNHICPVINLADKLYGTRGGILEKEIPILARGGNR
jgi:D-serine deaminase-like pyridoxal phosphate-dependent protein